MKYCSVLTLSLAALMLSQLTQTRSASLFKDIDDDDYASESANDLSLIQKDFSKARGFLQGFE